MQATTSEPEPRLFNPTFILTTILWEQWRLFRLLWCYVLVMSHSMENFECDNRQTWLIRVPDQIWSVLRVCLCATRALIAKPYAFQCPFLHTISGVGQSAAHGNFNLRYCGATCATWFWNWLNNFQIWCGALIDDDSKRYYNRRTQSHNQDERKEGDVSNGNDLPVRIHFLSTDHSGRHLNLSISVERRSTKSSRWAGNMDVFCHLPKVPDAISITGNV